MKRNKLWISFMFIIFLFLLTACNKDASKENIVKDVLVVSQPSDPKSLDTQASNDTPSSRITSQIYDRLIEQDENMKIQAGLAESWEQTDPLTFVFHLRKGVKFHNGDELKASDVKFTIERAQKSPLVSELVENIVKVETPDDFTVIIKTSEPYVPILNNLSHTALSILNEKVVSEKKEEYGQHPIGTGPFQFVEWISSDKVVLEANEEYFKGAPKIKKIIFRNIPEQTNRILGLETGEIDLVYDIEGMDKNDVAENKKLNFIEAPGLTTVYLGFNLKKDIFKNEKVRKAIAYAVDLDSIINTVYAGGATKADSIIGPKVVTYSSGKTYEYNPEKAKKLLKEAGYPNGFKTSIWINNNPVRRDIAVIFQDQLKQIGIDVNVETLEWGAYLDRTAMGEHDMYILGCVSVTGDPDYGINLLVNSKMHGGPGNRSFYVNKKVDQLLQEGKSEMDFEKRNAIYKEIQDILQEELPMLYICYPNQNAAMNKNLKGFVLKPSGHHGLYHVYFE